jgi:hypothetical protein
MPRFKIALLGAAFAGSTLALSCVALSDSLPPDSIYRPLTTQPFSVVRAADEAAKLVVMPPAVTVEMAKGFSLYMVKAIMNGRADEIVDLAKTNLWH